MGIEDESPVTCAPAHEVVASVADEESNIIHAGEVDSGLHLLAVLGLDDIGTIVAASAGGRG